MGIFGKVKNAKATGNFRYFPPDFEGVVLITNVKADETRQGDDFVAATVKIIESNLENDVGEGKPPQQRALLPVKAGQERSWYVDMTKDAAAGNIKQFAIEATNSSEEEFDKMDEDEVEEACNALVGEEQPVANCIVGLRTGLNKKGTYTIHTWSRLEDDVVRAAAIKAREIGALTGPLCDMQAHLEEKPAKKGKAA